MRNHCTGQENGGSWNGPKDEARRENWYRKGGFDTVIIVPATPGSQLKHRYQKEVNEAGFKIKVVEQSGVTLKSMSQKSEIVGGSKG